MKTLGIADMMADYIISHKGENYKIDLGLDHYIKIERIDGGLCFEELEGDEVIFGTGLGDAKAEEIKSELLRIIGVYEDEIEEIKMD